MATEWYGLSYNCLSGMLAHRVAQDIVSVLKHGDAGLKTGFHLNGEVCLWPYHPECARPPLLLEAKWRSVLFGYDTTP